MTPQYAFAAHAGAMAPAGIERPNRTGSGLAAGTGAWGKVFEAQQMAALDRFHSVGNAVSAASAQRGPAGQPDLHGHPGQALATIGLAVKAMSGAGTAQPGAAVVPVGPLPAGAAVAPGVRQAPQGFACAAIAREAPGVTTRMPQADHCRQLAAVLEALTGRQWPRKNIHVAATADGMYVWLRDSAPAAGPDIITRLAAGLRTAFRHSGNPLAGASLNGIRII